MRCGSTSLYLLLQQHPEIFMSPIKEPMFWAAENLRRHGRDAGTVLSGKYITQEAYLGLFADAQQESWRGEASHYLYHGDVAGLLHEEVPDARLIVSLRNPSDRIFSEYLLRVRSWGLEGSFEDFLDQKRSGVV
ncbi:sulfotransferase [Rhodophyticola sp.]|uniref:sulfotransferase n=1 Tax=Rhodophyticola sp. TaxID=2680032 RepID=UPI003D29CB55